MQQPTSRALLDYSNKSLQETTTCCCHKYNNSSNRYAPNFLVSDQWLGFPQKNKMKLFCGSTNNRSRYATVMHTQGVAS